MTRGGVTTGAPLVLIGMLAALTFWLDRLVQGPARDLSAPSRNDPDYIVERLSGVNLGENGRATYTMSAAKMVHYPEDDSTVLTAPTFVSYGSSKATVTITATEAVVSAKGDHVYFQDQVRVTRSAYADASELVMRTTFLHVVPDRNLARTDRRIVITDASGTVAAEGMEMNTETRLMRLLSNVQGTYEPGKAPRGGNAAAVPAAPRRSSPSSLSE